MSLGDRALQKIDQTLDRLFRWTDGKPFEMALAIQLVAVAVIVLVYFPLVIVHSGFRKVLHGFKA